MILYFDASALVKEYLTNEPGADRVARIRREAERTGTSIVSRAEVVSAFAKAVRTDVLSADEAAKLRRNFQDDWPDLVRVQGTESVVGRADTLVWDHDLRGYDALQLASALELRDGLDTSVTFGAFDEELWQAAQSYSLSLFPENLPDLLDQWN